MFFEIALAQDAKKVAVNMSAWDAVTSASAIVQLTLLALVVMSVISWAIIFTKKKYFKEISDNNEKFLDFFWKASSFDEINSKISKYEDSPLALTFQAGFKELQRLAESDLAEKGSAKTPKLHGIDNIKRALRKSMDVELASFESKLSFLATTGSTGPFIGLFGTVWGIMNSFHKIGSTGVASLAVVAPGISEALVATAIGLATAIPAVVAYNHFLTTVKKEELELSNFTSDFLNIVKRNFFKEE